MADREQAASHPAPAPARPPVRADSRVERSRRTVLRATFELLYETGVAGFSIDEVARRSGVAKTTIYRHWPTREALVIDACSRIGDQNITPDTGSCEQDLTAILTSIAAKLQTANWSAVLPSIVDLAEREPKFADVHRRIQRGHAAPLRAALERGIDSGAIPADTNIAAAVAAMLGSLFYQRWFAREPIEDAFIAAIVESVTRTRPTNLSCEKLLRARDPLLPQLASAGLSDSFEAVLSADATPIASSPPTWPPAPDRNRPPGQRPEETSGIAEWRKFRKI